MRSTFVVLFTALLVSGNLGAQSLEESYAKLCSDPAKAKSEACQILAKSLVAKLQDQQSSQAESSTNAQPNAATRALWRKRWGFYMDLVGKTWFVARNGSRLDSKDAEDIHTFTWKIRGQELVARVTSPRGKTTSLTTLVWDEAHLRLIAQAGKNVNYLFTQPDGSVFNSEVTTATGTFRTSYRLLADGSVETASQLKYGEDQWTTFARNFMFERTPDLVSQERQGAEIAKLQRAEHERQLFENIRQQKAKRSAARWNAASAMLGGVTQAVAEATGSTGTYDESQANLNAAVADIQNAAAVERQQQAQTTPQSGALASRPVAELQSQPQRKAQPQLQLQSQPSDTTATETAAPAAAKQLRFVMSISLRNQPGDKVNPTCYSNIVSRPGPPGWGAPGFLPQGSAEQAREIVYGMKSDFIARCRASGREIISDGSFNFQLNQGQGDEERLQGMRARYSEDVSVTL